MTGLQGSVNMHRHRRVAQVAEALLCRAHGGWTTVVDLGAVMRLAKIGAWVGRDLLG